MVKILVYGRITKTVTLTRLLNECIRNPHNRKTVLVHEKCDKYDLHNQRLVSFLSSLYKVFNRDTYTAEHDRKRYVDRTTEKTIYILNTIINHYQ